MKQPLVLTFLLFKVFCGTGAARLSASTSMPKEASNHLSLKVAWMTSKLFKLGQKKSRQTCQEQTLLYLWCVGEIASSKQPIEEGDILQAFQSI